MIDSQPQNESASTPPESESENRDPNKLSPEEQLAQYEEQLKEEDWGHQPC
jgi:hypothetical protein